MYPIRMNRRAALSLLLLLSALVSCEPKKIMTAADKQPATLPADPAGSESITVGAGCFWCIEAAYRRIDGVYSATSGYMGGSFENPTYEQVCNGTTGHAEVVHIVFDPKKLPLDKVLSWFWELHDPTTLNRQGNDAGTQYRSAVFYTTEAQKKVIEASISEAKVDFSDPIVTEVTEATTFYPAENYHQDYYNQNQSQNSYCRYVIAPKLKKAKLEK
jgi:peptide-methionine (S)-S-oxide reductase